MCRSMAKVTAKAMASKKGIRSIRSAIEFFVEDTDQFLKDATQFVEDDFKGKASSASVGALAKWILSKITFDGGYKVSLEEGDAIFSAEEYDVIELEMKPYPSRYFVE